MLFVLFVLVSTLLEILGGLSSAWKWAAPPGLATVSTLLEILVVNYIRHPSTLQIVCFNPS